MSKGVGAMIYELSGGSPKSAKDYYGRKITNAEFHGDELKLTFEDGVKIIIWDDGQSCCESRYITMDDDPKDLIGQELRKIEVKEYDYESDGEFDNHEKAFVEVQGHKSSITFCTHNIHNGYYGGFGLSLDEVKS